MVRAAAAQFATTTDVAANLDACLRAIDGAAAEGADLVVLPEFANHISVYENAEHCREVAVDLDGAFLAACADRAAASGAHVVVTVTLRRPDAVTVTNVMFGPAGELLGTSDKQILMGNERAFLAAGDPAAPVVATVLGPIGMYSCMDGVTCETPRSLAAQGARLLTNSLNSFALDEAALHIPVRAAENEVFVVAANKVGPLLPAERVEQFAAELGVPADLLDGAGESQIVGPDGTVLAKAPRTGEAVVVADLDLATVAPVRRAKRRPELYAPLARRRTGTPPAVESGAVTVAALSSVEQSPRAVDAGARLVVLAELVDPPADLGPDVLVVSTAMVDGAHVGRLTRGGEVLGEQRQLHHTDRHPGVTVLGDRLATADTPIGRLVMLVGDDVLYPELGRLAAIDGCHVLAVSHAPRAGWEVALGLRERAAENRVCVVAAAPAGPVGGTVLLSPPAASLWAPDPDEAYDGTINTPVAVEADGGAAIGPIHPARALRREISRDTDVVAGRPWQRSSVLVARLVSDTDR